MQAEDKAAALKRMRYKELKPLVEFEINGKPLDKDYGRLGLRGTGKELKAICRDLKKYGLKAAIENSLIRRQHNHGKRDLPLFFTGCAAVGVWFSLYVMSGGITWLPSFVTPLVGYMAIACIVGGVVALLLHDRGLKLTFNVYFELPRMNLEDSTEDKEEQERTRSEQ